MRRVTDVTKEMPVSLQVSCSIFSSRLDINGTHIHHFLRALHELKVKKGACNGRSFLVASDWLNSVSFLLPGVRPKQLSSNNPAAQGKSETLRLWQEHLNGQTCSCVCQWRRCVCVCVLTANWRVLCNSRLLCLQTPDCPVCLSVLPPPAPQTWTELYTDNEQMDGVFFFFTWYYIIVHTHTVQFGYHQLM